MTYLCGIKYLRFCTFVIIHLSIVETVEGQGSFSSQHLPKEYDKNISIAESVNYTQYFPSPRTQGACMSCWAFSTVAILEYFILRKKGKRIVLSEQNLVDCSTNNYGCNGGWAASAYRYVRDEGISNGTKYVYKGVKQNCLRKSRKYPAILKIPNVCEIFLNGQENLLKKLLAIYGPVSGAMSTTDAFTNYKSGVFYDRRCQNHTVDHAITIVGYGTDKVQGDFWIIRNSWGKKWGLGGYAWVARNRDNACGIALFAMFPCE